MKKKRLPIWQPYPKSLLHYYFTAVIVGLLAGFCLHYMKWQSLTF